MEGDALISVYFPTEVKGAETAQNRVRLKNRITRIDRWLEELGWKPRDRAERLQTLTSLLDDDQLWQHQTKGLALFVADDGRVTDFALAEPPEERTVVSSVFHLRPLWPSLELVDLPVLALTRENTRLYRISRSQARLMDVVLPSYSQVNWFVDREKQRQQHPDAAGSKGARHGHEPAEDREEDLDRFLRGVIDSLPWLEGLTLLVMGDDALVARFRHLYESESLSAPNSGIDDADDIGELRRMAAPVIDSCHDAAERRRAEAATEALGTGRAITEILEALDGAVAGALSELMLARHAAPIWGQFDPSTLRGRRKDDQAPLDVDLLDRLLVHALATGAGASTLASERLGHDFVAIRRF